MLTDWINVQGVKITGAERLYPNGLNWEIKPGVNAIIGGTGLGKTTLVYALQFGVFGKMIVENYERIERDFFKDRLTNRSEKQTKATPAAIEVKFAVGKSVFIIRRNPICIILK